MSFSVSFLVLQHRWARGYRPLIYKMIELASSNSDQFVPAVSPKSERQLTSVDDSTEHFGGINLLALKLTDSSTEDAMSKYDVRSPSVRSDSLERMPGPDDASVPQKRRFQLEIAVPAFALRRRNGICVSDRAESLQFNAELCHRKRRRHLV